VYFLIRSSTGCPISLAAFVADSIWLPISFMMSACFLPAASRSWICSVSFFVELSASSNLEMSDCPAPVIWTPASFADPIAF
jgi:hypothetical protein